MEEFNYWTRWGLGLNDKQFANAFTTLGVFAASLASSQDEGLLEPSQPATDIEHLLYKIDLKMAVFNLILPFRKDKFIVPWRFPIHDQYVQVGKRHVLLSSLNPQELAEVWETLINDTKIIKLRFCITWYPQTELVRPWFRLLFEATPQNKAAYIELDARQAHLYMQWPLRLGFLPGNAAEDSIKKARFYWPANELTSTVRIDRDNANCDVLLFIGSSSQLLKTLLEPLVPQKTNLFIVRGTFEDNLFAMGQRLSSIATEGRASGFVFLAPSVTDEVLGRACESFCGESIHNQPLDVAVSEAFTISNPTDPVIFLSRNLASFQLEHVLGESTAE